jgi:hypothetical protein
MNSATQEKNLILQDILKTIAVIQTNFSAKFSSYLTNALGDARYLKLDQTTPQTVANGLPKFSSLTAGSILFSAAAGALSQDNTHLFWDAANLRLGINVAAPTTTIDLAGNFNELQSSTYNTSDYSMFYARLNYTGAATVRRNYAFQAVLHIYATGNVTTRPQIAFGGTAYNHCAYNTTYLTAFQGYVGSITAGGVVAESNTFLAIATDYQAGTATLHCAFRAYNQGSANITTVYGIYIDAQSGATNNYGGYFGSNVGFKNTAPAYEIDVTGAIRCSTGFGCNSKTPQTAYASGGALAAYATGTFGLDSDAHMTALYNLVVAIRAALVANGIMS